MPFQNVHFYGNFSYPCIQTKGTRTYSSRVTEYRAFKISVTLGLIKCPPSV